MGKKLSFSIAVNLLTENFKKGTNTVKNSLRSMQMQVLTFAAALGAGGLGLSGLISRFKDVARETSRVLTALKNVSAGTKGFAENLQFINGLAKTYGLEVNALTGNFAKFTAAATQANMPMEQQRKVFESLSRASTAFGLSSDETNGVFLALSQMMGKGKISSEELRKQMGEKLPIAMQAMAKAAGVSMGGLEKLLKQGKLMSAEIIPKFAEALNEMIPNVDTDNLEASINRLKNAFTKMVDSSGFKDTYKSLIDWLAALIESAGKNIQKIVVGIISVIAFVVGNSLNKTYQKYVATSKQIVAHANKTSALLRSAVEARVIARKRLEDLEVAYSQASGQKQLALAKKVEDAKVNYASRTAAARIALNNHAEARAASANVKAYGRFAKLGAVVTGVFKQIGSALKSMLSSFGFGAIIAGVTALIGHFVNLYKETKRVKGIFSEYKKEAQSIGDTQEVATLRAQLAIMNDKTRSQEEVNAAQKALQKMLGIEKGTQEEINKKVAKRIELLQYAARADFFAQKMVEVEDQNKTLSGDFEKKFRKKGYSGNASIDDIVDYMERNGLFEEKGFERNMLARFGLQAGGSGNFGPLKNILTEYKQNRDIIRDAEKELAAAVNAANTGGGTTTTTEDEDPDEKARKKQEKYQRLLDKQKLENERQLEDLVNQATQAEIDAMDEGSKKVLKQLELNYIKEKQALERQQEDLLHQRTEAAREIFETNPKNKGKAFDPTGIELSEYEVRYFQEIEDRILAPKQKYFKELADAYKSTDAKIIEETERFNAEIAALREAGLENEAKEAEKQKKKAISRLKREQIEETDLWKRLFDDFSRVSTESLIDLFDLAEEQLNSATDLGIEDVKALKEALNKLRTEISNRNPYKSLEEAYKRYKKAVKTGDKDGAFAAWSDVLQASGQISSDISEIGQSLSGLANVFNDELGTAITKVVSTVENGIKAFEAFGKSGGQSSGDTIKGISGIIGIITTVVGEIMNATFRAREYKKAVAQSLQDFRDAYKLLELSRMVGDNENAFGARSLLTVMENARLAAMAVKEYNDALSKTTKPVEQKRGGEWIGVYETELKAYEKGYTDLQAMAVKTRDRSGFANWLGIRDEYTSLKDLAKELWDVNGKFDVEAAKAFLETNKQITGEQRNQIQNVINLNEKYEEATNALKAEISNTFGYLGSEITDILVDAIKNGTDAWDAFRKAGYKALEDLGKKIVYELFFAKKFDKLLDDLFEAYTEAAKPKSGNQNKSGWDWLFGRAKQSDVEQQSNVEKLGELQAQILDDFFNNIGGDLTNAQEWLEGWMKKLEDLGFLGNAEQTASTGKFQSMDQDTGNRLDGRFAALQMSGVKIEALMSSLTVDTNNILNMSVSINSELQKHTSLFNEMRTIQLNSFYEIEGTAKSLKNIGDILVKIDKNTSNL